MLQTAGRHLRSCQEALCCLHFLGDGDDRRARCAAPVPFQQDRSPSRSDSNSYQIHRPARLKLLTEPYARRDAELFPTLALRYRGRCPDRCLLGGPAWVLRLSSQCSHHRSIPGTDHRGVVAVATSPPTARAILREASKTDHCVETLSMAVRRDPEAGSTGRRTQKLILSHALPGHI